MALKNAKQELLREIESRNLSIKCAEITREAQGYLEEECFRLKVNHSKAEYEAFLQKLDFKYDAGYGSQQLFGTVWLDNGCWLARDEYDGSEWWVYRRVPPIPRVLT